MANPASPTQRTAPAAAPHQGHCIALPQLLRLRAFARTLNIWQQPVAQHSMLTGQHSSRLRGRGLDFSEVRLYQPGDDVRYIDWRVSARRGITHSKLFQEEKQRHVLIVVDYSASLFFGTRVAFKSVVAAQVAALLAFAATQHHDRVSGLLFSGEQHTVFPYQPANHNLLMFLKKLSDTQQPVSKQPPNYAQLLPLFNQHSKRSGLIVIISDFHHLQPEHLATWRQLRQHHPILAISITDPFEQALPGTSVYRLRDDTQTCDINGGDPQSRAAYTQRFQQHQQRIHQLWQRANVRWLTLSTADHPTRFLQQHLGQHRC